MGGSVARGGIEDGLRSSGLAPALKGGPFCSLRGERTDWLFCWKRAVESMLMRREKRLLATAGVAVEVRLDVVEIDQRLRFRKPSLKPPKLLDLE